MEKRVCEFCGKEYDYDGVERVKVPGYRDSYNALQFCSITCRNKNKSRIMQQGYKKKTGYDYPFQNPEFHEKSSKTNLEKYGVKRPLQNKEIHDRQKQTTFERYGVDNIFKSDEFKEQLKHDNLIKYGKTSYLSTDECRKQLKEYWKSINMTPNQVHLTNLEDWNHDYFINNMIDDGYVNYSKVYDHFNCSEHYFRSHKDELELPPEILHNMAKMSHGQNEVVSFIRDLIDDEIIVNDRKFLDNHKELDILVPSFNLAIEYDGIYWHSNKDEFYHYNKTKECIDKGVRLYHIFSNEWEEYPSKWKSVIINALGLSDRLYARCTEIREVSYQDKSKFLVKNHLQGDVVSSVNLGLYYNNELVSIMTFSKSRYNKNYEYELLRFCNKMNLSVVGGASKLLKYFISNYNPKSIISYANLRWSIGNLYNKLGFDKIGQSGPNYFYFKPNNYDGLHSRVEFQKYKLRDKLDNFDESLTEKENMINNGYEIIYDCGNLSYGMMI